MPPVTDPPTPKQTLPGRLGRYGWTTLGMFCLAVGIVGIYLPGIPTAGPLILAAFMFGKGNPRLRQRMLESPLLASYRHYLDGSKPFTRTARAWAMFGMWSSIGISCWLLSYSAAASAIGLPACLIGGVVGTICILFYRW